MARRGKSPSDLGPSLLLALSLLAALLVVVWGFGSGIFMPFRTAPELEPEEYLDNSLSLQGNTYRLEGEVLNLLGWSPSAGRLVSLQVGRRVLPVLITPAFNHINIQRGQRLMLIVEVDGRGVLRSKNLRKS